MANHLQPIVRHLDEEALRSSQNLLYRNKDIAPVIQGHVLLVDDSALSRKIIGKMLLHLGVSLDIVNDGHEAVTAVTQQVYDLVFMDVQMPVMDGLEATSAIRRLPNGAELPIIALTASSAQPLFWEKGMTDYLAKPTTLKDLRNTLLRWLSSVNVESGRA